jgi:signal transduction histidine kinase
MLDESVASPPKLNHDAAQIRSVRENLASERSPVAWNSFRVRSGLAMVVVCLVLGGAWSWAGGYVLAGMAGIVFTDAYVRQARDSVALLPTVIFDITLIGLGLVLTDLDPAGVAAPYIYTMAVPLLLFPTRRAVSLMAYATFWGAAALGLDSPLSTSASFDRGAASAFIYILFTVLLLVLIAVLGRALSKATVMTERRLKAEAALAVAGEELLANVSENALTLALEAIRGATGAAAAFVAENSGDRHSGPAAVVRQVSTTTDSFGEPTSMKWTLPYMQHREAASELARGRSVRMDDPLGMVMGRESGTTAALAVPIFLRGEWAGFLGIAYEDELPEPGPDVSVLETIAAMIAAFLERQEAYAKLEKSVRSKDQFLASVSHEIRTPLTSILGFSALLREDPDSLSGAEAQDLVSLIQLQSQDVTDLVEDLLVAARAEMDAVSITREPVVLSEEVERVLATRVDSGQKDIHIATSHRHVAMADPMRVRQILRNLLTNAIRYGGDQITITTHRDAPEVTLVFSDNGEGVPPEHRRRIFDPYHRGQEFSTMPESIGLGLAVSRQLARLMDGDLTLRSDLGPATFQLSLQMAPRTPNPDAGADQETVLAAEFSAGS